MTLGRKKLAISATIFKEISIEAGNGLGLSATIGARMVNVLAIKLHIPIEVDLL